MNKLIRITTVPISIHKLLSGQPLFMKNQGFDVKLVSSDGHFISKIELETGISVKVIPYSRAITPIADLRSLWLTYKYIKKEKPQIVHTHTPKAGLIGMLAAYLLNVPIRMHTVAGLPLMETRGIKRRVLNVVERLTSFCASNVYPNSNALKDFMLEEQLCSKSKIKVIGHGSSNGIDLEYYAPSLDTKEKSDKVRKDLGINESDFVFGFVGRVVKDKGISELVKSFCSLNDSSTHLLIIGPFEEELDSLDEGIMNEIEKNNHIHHVGYKEDVRPFFMAMNTFVFPSYREGFPNVVLQASALSIPSIVSNINGSNEIINDKVNGLVVPVKNEVSLTKAMFEMYKNNDFRKKVSSSIRNEIMMKYDQKYIWRELLKEYNHLLESNV
ncbi:glycosyltransferase family 4 protein [Flammeovirga sp. SJP92]|uniref:glycosyltransferase family 4 protein n=1 Tax=Flammeovirga sp. SJP92 TaxID=1775430 RepID=UPI0009ED7DAA|nr:glycosyltransferase family 4 protein [Flammeovirga sp. SJP92]